MDRLFCDISDRLDGAGFFKKIYRYTEMIVRKDKTKRPMFFDGGWKDVQDWDVNGTVYIRKRGKVRLEVDPEKQRTASCQDLTRRVKAIIPIRIVATVPREALTKSILVDDNLAWDLIGILQGSYPDTALAMNAFKIVLRASEYDTESSSVWNGENTGIPFDENKSYRFSYIAIDFDVEIKGDVECFKNCLSDGYY